MMIQANRNEMGSRDKKADGGKTGFSATALMPQDRIAEKQVVPASARMDHKVLVVGPYTAPRSIIKESLGKMGYCTLEAEGFLAAMKCTSSERPDVVIVDVDVVAEYPPEIGCLKGSWPSTKIIVLDGGYGNGVPDRKKALVDAGVDIVLDETAYGDLENAVEQLMPVNFSGKEPEKRLTNGKTVLIVCKDRDLGEAGKAYIGSLGYDILNAWTYQDAAANAAGADLVIIDQGEEWECLEVITAMKAVNPALKIVIRPELETESKDPRLRVARAVLPAIDGWGEIKNVLAEHLPLAAATGETMIRASPATAKKHTTVLVVDDEYLVAEMLKAMVEDVRGYTAITAANGAKGLEAYRKAFEAGNPPDVIVSDRQMPVMCGADMVGEIRKINPAAKVVFLTGGANASDMADLQKLDPVAILEKPVNVKMFCDAIDRALSA